ncbi:MAG: acetate--CoA ligase family protein [Chloroflexi bacterium]|nr:acetate--CoA ligase family protein [Chloroflexota bacterium]
MDETGALLENALERGGSWLEADEVRRLLGMYEVRVVGQRLVATVAEAANAAAELGGETALKARAPGLRHKSDVGGVRLHLRGPRWSWRQPMKWLTRSTPQPARCPPAPGTSPTDQGKAPA